MGRPPKYQNRINGGLYKGSYVSDKYKYCQLCGNQVPPETLKHIDDPNGKLDKGVMACPKCYNKEDEV